MAGITQTDLLDNFGALVFERIRERGAGFDPKTGTQRGPLGNKFSHKDVSDIAKQTCRNWFYKVASLKELLPRFYLEARLAQSTSAPQVVLVLHSQRHRSITGHAIAAVRAIKGTCGRPVSHGRRKGV